MIVHHRKGGYRVPLPYWHHVDVQLFIPVCTLAGTVVQYR